MATKYDATVRLLMENRDFIRDSRKAESAVDDVGRSSNRTRQSFLELGKRAALTFGAGGAIAGIVAWTNAGTELAASAQLVADSMDKVLGPASDRLYARNQELATQMGLTRGEFEKAILPFANVGDSLGLAADANEELLGSLFTAAADIAVFNGEIGGTVDIMESLQSATRGEYDALQRYIPAISAAAVEQRALEETGKASATELTELDRLMATYAIVLDEATRAQGAANDAISDGLTAQQGFNAEMRETQTTVGDAAQTLKSTFFQALAAVIGLLQAFGRLIARTIMWLDDLGDAGIPVVSALANLFAELLKWGWRVETSIDGVRQAVERLVSPLVRVRDALMRIPRSIRNPFSGWRMPRIPGFATGGTVPGPRGAPQLAMVHGGERITTPHQDRNAAAGITINVQAGLADPQTIARDIVNLLELYNRTNGAIPIETVSQ